MSRRLLSHSLVGLSMGFLGGIAGCSAPDLSQPCPIPPGATEAERIAALNACFKVMSADVVDTRLIKDIDVLFLVDNSTSMSPKQKAIAQAIPAFIQKIDATKSNYHIGVTTSDVGTLPPGKTSFPGGAMETRCNTLRGDDGQLQNKACSARLMTQADMMSEFGQACKGTMNPLCPDPSFVPSNAWISKDGDKVNVSTPSAMGLTPSQIAQRAFQCIGLVGDFGCGVEAPLEAAKRALDEHLPANNGFLRPNSVLAVIFLTDEDDCSVQIAQRQLLDPAAISCGTASTDPEHKCFNLDYRCIAKSTVCNEPLSTTGLKTNCRESPGNFLEPVDKYVKFFSALRPKEKLILAGIWTPSIQDFQSSGGTGPGKLFIEGAGTDVRTDVLNRGQQMNAACLAQNSAMWTTDSKGFFGQAQHRLSSFIRKFDKNVYVERSICDPANYSAALDSIAEKVVKALNGDCLAVKPLQQNGAPACLVGFVDVNQPDALPDTYLPQCSAGCCNAWATAQQPVASTPSIQTACMPETKDCYCAVDSKVPAPDTRCTDTAVAGVWRAGNKPVDSNKVVSFRCAGTRPPTTASYDQDQSVIDVQ
ncbi:MAG: VWA domain-containing protein [Myxococcales bacterium]|nr:VWA domain-containing protein [Myxococcales bacterium]